MIRNAILGIAAAVIMFAAAATLVSTTIYSASASASHSVYGAVNKPSYLKGAIAKHCLDNHGACALVVQ
ncbi:hypothetical protein [Pseudorhodoplanes sp.]|uniref:hypothetical protein n=1 Tax=Pseudorhodoplanes sp. TaxID=1934341 RepID=UPI003D145BFA